MSSHILHQNLPSLISSLPPPSFSHIMCSGAETAQVMHTHTPCNAIVKFRLEAILKSFCPICAQTWSKNRSGQFFNIALLTIYNCILCTHCTPSHLHSTKHPMCAQKFPTFFLFFHLGSFTQEREPCTLQPPHTRTLIHSLSLQ